MAYVPLQASAEALLDERTALADPALLRAAPFSTVVAGLGELLEPTGTIAASAGAASSEDTFIHSRQVDLLHSVVVQRVVDHEGSGTGDGRHVVDEEFCRGAGKYSLAGRA